MGTYHWMMKSLVQFQVTGFFCIVFKLNSTLTHTEQNLYGNIENKTRFNRPHTASIMKSVMDFETKAAIVLVISWNLTIFVVHTNGRIVLRVILLKSRYLLGERICSGTLIQAALYLHNNTQIPNTKV